MAELREEMTRALPVAVMAEARAAQAERRAQESAILLASTHEETNEVTHKVAFLEGELAVVRQAQVTTEAKLPGLVRRVANADRQ
jgi:hypothetical protein